MRVMVKKNRYHYKRKFNASMPTSLLELLRLFSAKENIQLKFFFLKKSVLHDAKLQLLIVYCMFVYTKRC